MKKIILPILLCGCLTFMSSCEQGFDSMNTTSTGITQSQILPGSVFLRNVWKGVSADYQRNYNLYDDLYAHYFADGTTWWSTDNYAYNDGWGSKGWEAFYTERQKEFLNVNAICGSAEGYTNMKAVNDVWNIILWLRMVDRWGDVPYKDASGNYATATATALPFNSQKEIYMDLLSRLDKDGSSITTTSTSQYDAGSYDLLYGGNANIAKWKRLAYSLMLRLAVRISNVDAATAKIYAAKAIAGGVMNSNDDNANVQCDDSRWQDYYGAIVYDWKQGSISADFLNFMTGKMSNYSVSVQDPRCPLWFSPGTKGYVGVPQGLNPSGDFFKTYNYGDYAELHIRTTGGFFTTDRVTISNSKLQFPIMDYSEVCFLKAEAALRGLISGTSETYYKDGITASIKYVASHSGVTVSDADITAYINALPSYASASSKEAQLRLICIQEYIALFPNSQEAWTLIRRTGYPDNLSYPAYINGSGLVSDGNWIQRISYTDSEYANDAANIPTDYKAGGSKYAKREQYGLWWSLPGEGNVWTKTSVPANKF